MNFKKPTRLLKRIIKSPLKNFSISQMSNIKTDRSNEDANPNLESQFECNICLETAKNAVISMCGHLFCWPCLHQWLETKPNNQVCPVCKAAISSQKVIPLYGRGFSSEDPRKKFPPRPKAQRTEPQSHFSQAFPTSFSFMIANLQMAFGGAFPFAIITSTFNINDNLAAQDYSSEREINKIFLVLAIIFIVWLIFA